MRFPLMVVLTMGLPLGAVQAATVSFSGAGETSGGEFLDLELTLPFFDATLGTLTGARLTYGFVATSWGNPDEERAFDDSSEYFGTCALDAQLWVESDNLPVGGSDRDADGYDCGESYLAEASVGETFVDPSFLHLLLGTGSFTLSANTFHEPTNILNFATALRGSAEVVYEYQAALAPVPLPFAGHLLAAAVALGGLCGRRRRVA